MRVMTWNVNGLRAALRKGFAEDVRRLRPDVMLLQEVRSQPDQLPPQWAQPRNWHVHWHPAQKKGYAGTAIWSRRPIDWVETGMGEDDPEGRVLRARIDGLQLVSVYLPSGSSGDHRQQAKEAWMQRFFPWAQRMLAEDDPLVMGGDFNIAHTEKDIFYAKSNEKTSGFLPHERAWWGQLMDQGWHDLIREHAGDVQGPYTWWSNRGRARELDRGWRIDYLLANPAARHHFKRAAVDRKAGLTTSDHAPVVIDLSL